MSPDVQDSVFLVMSSDEENQQFGTGFAIDRDEEATYLLTCRHVVMDVGGPTRVRVGDRLAEMVASGSEDGLEDVAVLRAKGSVDVPTLGLRVSGEMGNSVTVAGFRPFARSFLIRSIRGTLGERIGLEARQQAGRIVAWDLKITDDFDLERGYSGAPMIDDETGDVIAVASHRIGDRRGVAISIRTVEHIWPGTLSRTQRTYLRKIDERELEIYLTGPQVDWDKEPLLRYSDVPEGYQLFDFGRQLFGLSNDRTAEEFERVVGEEFKHFVVCEKADVERIKVTLTIAGYAVTGDGTEEPGDPSRWRIWFLRRDYKATDDDYEHPGSNNLWFRS